MFKVCVHSTLSTVIYLLERINFLHLKVWTFDLWLDRNLIWSNI